MSQRFKPYRDFRNKWCRVKIIYLLVHYSIHTKHTAAHTHGCHFARQRHPKHWINIVLLLLLCCPVAWCWRRQTQTQSSTGCLRNPVSPITHSLHSTPCHLCFHLFTPLCFAPLLLSLDHPLPRSLPFFTHRLPYIFPALFDQLIQLVNSALQS